MKNSWSHLNECLNKLEAEFVGDFTQKDLHYLQEVGAFERAIQRRKKNEYLPAFIYRAKHLATTGIKLKREQAREKFRKITNG